MTSRIRSSLTQFVFYLLVSFTTATAGYFILRMLSAGKEVFGSLYRMYSYHYRHPLSYILIPCVVYSMIVSIAGGELISKSIFRQLMLTLAIAFFTILFSFPIGGMLYYYHDMQAGYFPDNWLPVMMENGVSAGFENGWLIILLSFPYNLLGIVVCYFITKWGNRMFYTKQPIPQS